MLNEAIFSQVWPLLQTPADGKKKQLIILVIKSPGKVRLSTDPVNFRFS